MNITTLLLTRDCTYSFVDVVPLDVIPHLETRFNMDRISRKACLQWRTWTIEQFCYELRKAVPDTAIARPHSSLSFYELIAKLPVQFDLENESYE